MHSTKDPDDAMRRLLPELAGERAGRARSVATLLRLVDVEARSSAPQSVGLSLDRALAELERDRRAMAARALASLCVHHLDVALGPDSFLSLPAPELPAIGCWRELLEHGGARPGLFPAPCPGEVPTAAVQRLLGVLSRLAGRTPVVRRLELAAVYLREGPLRSERRFRGLARVPGLGLAARVARVECLLDAGAVGRARALAGRPIRWSSPDPRLTARGAELRAWTELLSGTRPRPVAPAGPLPLALRELARRRPEWRPYLSHESRPHRRAESTRMPLLPWRELRSTLGCAVAAGFLRGGPAGGPFPVELDCAPELDCERVRFVAEARPGLAALGERGPHVLHAGGGPGQVAGLEAGLGKTLSSAAALAIVRAGRGWVWLEFEHHLVPSARRLGLAAESFLNLVGTRAAAPTVQVGPRPTPQPTPARHARWRVESLRGVASGLRAEEHGRAWWGVLGQGRSAHLVAGGGGPGDAAAGSSALAAARAPGPRRRRDDSVGVRSRFVLPLVSRGAALGALVFDSSREHDFGPAWQELARGRAESGADLLRVARARDWFRVRRGREVWFDPRSVSGAELFESVLRAADAHGPVAIVGPAGAGKSLVADWVLLERAHPDFPPASVHLELEAGSSARILESALESEREPVVVEELQRLGPDELARLGRTRARREGFVTTWTADSLAELLSGPVPGPAAGPMVGVAVHVPALAERREDVPGLAERLLAASLEQLGSAVSVPPLDDESRAWLWRQPWPGNVRQLVRLAQRVAHDLTSGEPPGCRRAGAGVSEGAGGACGPWDAGPADAGRGPRLADLRRAARALAFADLERLNPSTTPASLVRAALHAAGSTGRGRGSNRRRAAARLGWHRSTLARKLASTGGADPDGHRGERRAARTAGEGDPSKLDRGGRQEGTL